MRASRLLPLLLGSALLVAGCATPQSVTKFGLNRDSPGNTYEYFKAAAAANQWAAEWSVFSPNAKRQADELAGRHVDVGDYSTARQTIATNGTAEMAMLLQSTLVGQSGGPNDTVGSVTIAAGGRPVTVRMVKLTSWELREKGVEEPMGGFLRSAGDAVVPNADGSITVRVQPQEGTAAVVRTLRREQIDGFAVKSMWYVDDLSSLQGAVTGMGAQAPSGPAQPAQPTAPPPAGPELGAPE